MNLQDWIMFFEEMDLSQPSKFNYKTAIGSAGRNYVQNNVAGFEGGLRELKRKIGHNISYRAKLHRLNQIPNPVPYMPDFGTDPNKVGIAEANWQLSFNLHEFLNAYKEFLTEKIVIENNGNDNWPAQTASHPTSTKFDLSKYDTVTINGQGYFEIRPEPNAFFHIYDGGAGVNRYQYFRVPINSTAGLLCAAYYEKYYLNKEHRINAVEEMQQLLEACKTDAVDTEVLPGAFLRFWNDCKTTQDKLRIANFQGIYHFEALKNWYTLKLEAYIQAVSGINASEAAKQANILGWKAKLAENVEDFLKSAERKGERLSEITYDHAAHLIRFYEWLMMGLPLGKETIKPPVALASVDAAFAPDHITQAVKKVSACLREMVTLEVEVKEFYLQNGEYHTDITPSEVPGLPMKVAKLLALSRYTQETEAYKNFLDNLRHDATVNVALLSKQQIKNLLVIADNNLIKLNNFFAQYSEIVSKYAESTITISYINNVLNKFFTVPNMPKYGMITKPFLEDLQSAAMFKQAALLEFVAYMRGMAGIADADGDIRATERISDSNANISGIAGFGDIQAIVKTEPEKIDETRPSIAAYAIMHVYLEMFGGKAVSQQNKKSLVEAYGYKSGQQLRNEFTLYQDEEKRLDLHPTNKKSANTHLQRFEKILPLLKIENEKAFQKAKTDYETLKKKYKTYY